MWAPPDSFADHAGDPRTLVWLGLAAAMVALAFRRRLVSLLLVGAGVAIAVIRVGGALKLGPSALHLPSLHAATIWTAFVALVVPQLPLTFANSCIATGDAARTYFGEAARRVQPGRLATSLGVANLLSGAIAGMPVCHGAGGMTAHRAFGARTGGAPLAMGAGLIAVALALGAGLTALLAAFPLPILAGLRDLAGTRAWTIALLIGVTGMLVNLAVALAAGLALWWAPVALARLRRRPADAVA